MFNGGSAVVDLLFIVRTVSGGSVFGPCFVLRSFFVYRVFATTLLGKRELIDLL